MREALSKFLIGPFAVPVLIIVSFVAGAQVGYRHRPATIKIIYAAPPAPDIGMQYSDTTGNVSCSIIGSSSGVRVPECNPNVKYK